MKPKRNGGRPDRNGVSSKDRSLEPFREGPDETALTTDQGARVHHTDDSLKAGRRGPTLLEDFHLREKITRFDHERIPERVVHARGSAAHGFFQVYESMAKLTRAGFLQDPRTRTPVPSPALSMTTTVKDTIKGRVIAALVAPGVAGRELTAARKALEAAGAKVEIVAPALGMVATADGTTLEATRSLLTVKSVLFDAVLIPGGADSRRSAATPMRAISSTRPTSTSSRSGPWARGSSSCAPPVSVKRRWRRPIGGTASRAAVSAS